MSIHSHPSEAMLLAYAGGTLPSGSSLVLAAHLEFCSECRIAVATWELAGGTVLDSMPAAEMSSDALVKTIARFESGPRMARRPQRVLVPLEGIKLPSVISKSGVAQRRWMAPGIWTAAVPSVSRGHARTYLLRLGPKRKLPLHGHSGSETICVLKGSFSDASGRYEVGDFLEMDEAVDHQPAVGPEGECICIVASEAPPRIRGLLGWLTRPFWSGKSR